jgi:hypothetical protein
MQIGLGLSLTQPRGGGGQTTEQWLAANAAVWLDPSDLSTMKQERTGASATTAVAVGDPVGSMLNKGTLGGWFIAGADASRPAFRQPASLRYMEYDGTDDCLYSSAAINLSATDEITIVAGAYNARATTAILTEFSAATASNAGSFYLTGVEDATIEWGSISRGIKAASF